MYLLSTLRVQWLAFVSTVKNVFDSWPLKLGPIGFPETSARNYHKTLPAIPEERRYERTWNLRVQVFRVVTLCCWVSGFRRFEGKYCCNLQGQAVQEGLFYYFFSEKSGTTNPTTRRHIAEDCNPQPHLCENLKCVSIRAKYIAESH